MGINMTQLGFVLLWCMDSYTTQRWFGHTIQELYFSLGADILCPHKSSRADICSVIGKTLGSSQDSLLMGLR